MEQHVRALGRPFLGNALGLVVAQAVHAGAHDHHRRRDPVDPASVVTSARDDVHMAVAQLFGCTAHHLYQLGVKRYRIEMPDRLDGNAQPKFLRHGREGPG